MTLRRVLSIAAISIGGALLAKQLKKSSAVKNGSSIQEWIEVDVPVSTAYDQWTQFEEFPKFMENVLEVRQLTDDTLHWRASVAGVDKEWNAKITEQVPDMRIAWCSTTGSRNAGVVTFHKISDIRTRIMLQLDYEPEGALEKVGDAVGTVSMQAKASLKNFKTFIESRGNETGAWRGTIAQH